LPALSPDGKTLACADPDTRNTAVQIHDVDTGKRRSSWTNVLVGPTCRMAFAPDGRTLAVVSRNTLQVVACDDGSIRQTIELPSAPYAPVFSRDGKKIYHSHHWKESENYFVETDLQTGQMREYSCPPGGCMMVAVNPEFPILASSDAKSLQIWDAEAGPGQTPYSLPVGCAAEQIRFTPEGRHLIVGSDHGIFVFRLPVDRKVGDWKTPERAKTESDEDREGFGQIFNGQDLTGWKAVAADEKYRAAAEWALRIGAEIMIEAAGKREKILHAKRSRGI
jgi:WD40 repeat protein